MIEQTFHTRLRIDEDVFRVMSRERQTRQIEIEISACTAQMRVDMRDWAREQLGKVEA